MLYDNYYQSNYIKKIYRVFFNFQISNNFSYKGKLYLNYIIKIEPSSNCRIITSYIIIHSIFFIHSFNYLIFTSNDNAIIIYDMNIFKKKRTFSLKQYELPKITQLSNDKILLTSEYNPTSIYILDLNKMLMCKYPSFFNDKVRASFYIKTENNISTLACSLVQNKTVTFYSIDVDTMKSTVAKSLNFISLPNKILAISDNQYIFVESISKQLVLYDFEGHNTLVLPIKNATIIDIISLKNSSFVIMTNEAINIIHYDNVAQKYCTISTITTPLNALSISYFKDNYLLIGATNNILILDIRLKDIIITIPTAIPVHFISEYKAKSLSIVFCSFERLSQITSFRISK